MQPLIDADILAYEIGFSAEWGWEDEDETPPFSYAEDLLLTRIEQICYKVGADEPPILFLTGEGNFREKLATTRPYKGNRKEKKPFHYKNLRVYMEAVFDTRVIDGMEADDALCIEQMKSEDTIICSRDKDLRMCPGWHYGWEVGKQPEFGPEFVEEPGWIHWDGKKIAGVGSMFFLSQCITGDSVDNIPGLPRKGPAAAYKILFDTHTYEEGLEAVRGAYRAVYGDAGDSHLLEQGQLLWMVRELDENREPVMWNF